MTMATTGAAPAQLDPPSVTADTLDMVDMAGIHIPLDMVDMAGIHIPLDMVDMAGIHIPLHGYGMYTYTTGYGGYGRYTYTTAWIWHVLLVSLSLCLLCTSNICACVHQCLLCIYIAILLCRWPRGSRVVLLKKDSLSVETYVRMENGSIIDGNTLPL